MADHVIRRNNEYWKWVEKDATEDSYARTLATFVGAGIRSAFRDETRCRLPLTETFKTQALLLYNALERSTIAVPVPVDGTKDKIAVPRPLIDLLQDFFFSCVTATVDVAADKKFSTPVQVYMACFGYRKDDTFKAPSEVTSVLAKWQFLLRATALYHAASLSERDSSVSAFEWVSAHLAQSTRSVTDILRPQTPAAALPDPPHRGPGLCL